VIIEGGGQNKCPYQPIESTIYRLPSEQADNIRKQITNILSKAKPPPSNITGHRENRETHNLY